MLQVVFCWNSLRKTILKSKQFVSQAIDFGKIDGLGVYAVFQKQNDSEYKFPYQNKLMNEIFNCSGFNRLYFKDQMAYT